MDTSVFTNQINAAWADIHHCRNQDWKFWATLGAIALAIGGFGGGGNQTIMPLLLVAGLFVGTLAAIVSYSHWRLLQKKHTYVDWLEAKLAVHMQIEQFRYRSFDARFPPRVYVSGLIFASYVALAVGFATGLVGLLWVNVLGGAVGLTFIASAAMLLAFYVSYSVGTIFQSRAGKEFRAHYFDNAGNPI